MEKRFTSSNKRIVEFCNLMESVKLKHMIDARILILEDVTSLGSLYISQDKTTISLALLYFGDYCFPHLQQHAAQT